MVVQTNKENVNEKCHLYNHVFNTKSENFQRQKSHKSYLYLVLLIVSTTMELNGLEHVHNHETLNSCPNASINTGLRIRVWKKKFKLLREGNYIL